MSLSTLGSGKTRVLMRRPIPAAFADGGLAGQCDFWRRRTRVSKHSVSFCRSVPQSADTAYYQQRSNS